ncbi:dipeptidase [Scatolibacter rhodanostii]|uniref:dipeptidase n=1 Tax=Scatolibacter rhodanostii TaxID=2014781 RepID=UPI0013566728|nr:dipeptidase [Scatolibacter rhodanostii]
MKYFDLHCDTIVECAKQQKGLRANDLHIDIERGKTLEQYVQCFAVFIQDTIPEEEAFLFFEQKALLLRQECKKNKKNIRLCHEAGDLAKARKSGKMGAVLTIENGSALSGNLENLDRMAKLGVKMITLTWNGDNKIGTGAATDTKKGITPFGILALKKMERLGIVADISHASDYLFEDVAALSQKPIVASHSNSRKVFQHRRNLTDEQFEVICRKKGLVGLNFYKEFLRSEADEADMEDILRHAEHFLSLGGEDVVAMGSDFDGADMPKGIKGIESVGELYNLFLQKNYKESLVRKIFFENAESFFIRNNLL